MTAGTPTRLCNQRFVSLLDFPFFKPERAPRWPRKPGLQLLLRLAGGRLGWGWLDGLVGGVVGWVGGLGLFGGLVGLAGWAGLVGLGGFVEWVVG